MRHLSLFTGAGGGDLAARAWHYLTQLLTDRQIGG